MKMLSKIDHIGIAVSNIQHSLTIFEDILGIKCAGEEVLNDQNLKVAFLPIGDSEIELLQSIAEEGTIAKFIEKRGEGIHHIAFRVEKLEDILKNLDEKGVQLIDKKPRYGAGGAKIAFLHPKSTNGVLIELCEHQT